MTKKLPKSLQVFLILILALFLLTRKIDKPFWGHHDWNSVVYSNIARNYIRYGYIKTKFGQVTSVDLQKPEHFTYITHYPPLLPILISINFRIFGQSELAARSTIVLFSLILIFFIYEIGNELGGKLMGSLASISLTLTPIFMYFGKLPVHDTIVPAISAAGFWSYIRYIKTKSNKYYALLAITIIIGGLINWSAYYLVPALLFMQITTKAGKQIRGNIYKLMPLAILIFLIQIIHTNILDSASTGSIFSNVLERIDPYLTSSLYGFAFFKYIRQELLYLRIYYTMPVFLGSAFFILLTLFNIFKKQRRLNSEQLFIYALFIYGAIQLVLFSQLSFIHDYMIYYLAPFMSLSFAYIATKMIDPFKKSLICPILLIGIFYFIFVSQLKFTKALIATDTNKRGFLVGQLINKESPSGSLSYITSNSYKEFQEVFIGYYSDRNVSYGESLPRDFESKYELIVRPKDHDPLPVEQKEILDTRYLRYEDNNFIWYKTKFTRSKFNVSSLRSLQHLEATDFHQ